MLANNDFVKEGKKKKKCEWVRINLFATGINIVSIVKWFQLLKNYSSKCHCFKIICSVTAKVFILFILVWFLCLMAYQLFLGYLMPKPFS